MRTRIVRILLPAALAMTSEQLTSDWLCSPREAFAITYLSVEQAQEILSPSVHWVAKNITLTDEQVDAIEDRSGVSVLNPEMKVWISPQKDLFIVDNVLGKHEYITYALLISTQGKVKGIEILDYRETYGDQIRRPEWRAQFIGKGPGDKVELEEDILNISGATISCSQITKGTRRILATFDLVLKNILNAGS